MHESRLLLSIGDRGFEEPLEGVDGKEGVILLNGFKRYRCARKLGIGKVPFISLGSDEAMGIMGLLRVSNNKALSILEQARFIDDLKKLHLMSVGEIAEELSRSKSWVSMRIGLMGEMTEKIRKRIFSGAFPVYSYMYLVRQFMRMNGVKKEEVEDFVVALSGKKLSVREIEQLAHGYFRGPEWFRQEIQGGNLALPLERIKQVADNPDGCNEFERVLLNDLELTDKYMRRVTVKSQDQRLKTRAFHAQANLLAAGLLSRARGFYKIVREIYDRSGQAENDISVTRRGDEVAGDLPTPARQPQHGPGDNKAAGGDAGYSPKGQDQDR